MEMGSQIQITYSLYDKESCELSAILPYMKQYVTIFVILAVCVIVSALMWNVPVSVPAPHKEQNPPVVVIPTPENPSSPEESTQPIDSEPTPIKKCYAGGCSGQICSDDPNAVSTCEWTEAYACYQSATCEVQPTGECGWTETSQLTACLETAI